MGDDHGPTTATADNGYSSDTVTTDNTIIQFDDGSIYDTTTGDMYDANGQLLQSTTSGSDGTIVQFSDGTILDKSTGNRFDAEGTQIGDNPSKGINWGSFTPGGGGGIPLTKGGGSPASNAQQSSALSKALGSIGTSLTSLLSRPATPTPQQRAINQATGAGAAPVLNGTGTGIFLVGALVVVFILLKG